MSLPLDLGSAETARHHAWADRASITTNDLDLQEASVLGAEASAGFCVFIHEPLGRQRPVPVQVLKELYGLTAAEARLVNSLYVGQSLQSAAATGGISLNTAKTVLKHVFVKCEVSSQAELLQLLALGPRVA